MKCYNCRASTEKVLLQSCGNCVVSLGDIYLKVAYFPELTVENLNMYGPNGNKVIEVENANIKYSFLSFPSKNKVESPSKIILKNGYISLFSIANLALKNRSSLISPDIEFYDVVLGVDTLKELNITAQSIFFSAVGRDELGVKVNAQINGTHADPNKIIKLPIEISYFNNFRIGKQRLLKLKIKDYLLELNSDNRIENDEYKITTKSLNASNKDNKDTIFKQKNIIDLNLTLYKGIENLLAVNGKICNIKISDNVNALKIVYDKNNVFDSFFPETKNDNTLTSIYRNNHLDIGGKFSLPTIDLSKIIHDFQTEFNFNPIYVRNILKLVIENFSKLIVQNHSVNYAFDIINSPIILSPKHSVFLSGKVISIGSVSVHNIEIKDNESNIKFNGVIDQTYHIPEALYLIQKESKREDIETIKNNDKSNQPTSLPNISLDNKKKEFLESNSLITIFPSLFYLNESRKTNINSHIFQLIVNSRNDFNLEWNINWESDLFIYKNSLFQKFFNKYISYISLVDFDKSGNQLLSSSNYLKGIKNISDYITLNLKFENSQFGDLKKDGFELDAELYNESISLKCVPNSQFQDDSIESFKLYFAMKQITPIIYINAKLKSLDYRVIEYITDFSINSEIEKLGVDRDIVDLWDRSRSNGIINLFSIPLFKHKIEVKIDKMTNFYFPSHSALKDNEKSNLDKQIEKNELINNILFSSNGENRVIAIKNFSGEYGEHGKFLLRMIIDSNDGREGGQVMLNVDSFPSNIVINNILRCRSYVRGLISFGGVAKFKSLNIEDIMQNLTGKCKIIGKNISILGMNIKEFKSYVIHSLKDHIFTYDEASHILKNGETNLIDISGDAMIDSGMIKMQNGAFSGNDDSGSYGMIYSFLQKRGKMKVKISFYNEKNIPVYISGTYDGKMTEPISLKYDFSDLLDRYPDISKKKDNNNDNNKLQSDDHDVTTTIYKKDNNGQNSSSKDTNNIDSGRIGGVNNKEAHSEVHDYNNSDQSDDLNEANDSVFDETYTNYSKNRATSNDKNDMA